MTTPHNFKPRPYSALLHRRNTARFHRKKNIKGTVFVGLSIGVGVSCLVPASFKLLSLIFGFNIFWCYGVTVPFGLVFWILAAFNKANRWLLIYSFILIAFSVLRTLTIWP